ncbi:hypothetical protein DBV15_10507 [Temnothorax longispinosus]|uniref:Uncharacterized protein n=1 Tax=Temnothorax longispinosus TaxID=300112 RepID=A0A4S2KRL8_9HYME|nr:hypothetical protein DBV15_10507 [Temnothorax longispinosus]
MNEVELIESKHEEGRIERLSVKLRSSTVLRLIVYAQDDTNTPFAVPSHAFTPPFAVPTDASNLMEREGGPPLAAAPYKVRPDETINSIRQKRAPGTPVHTEGTPRRRIIRHRGTALCFAIRDGTMVPMGLLKRLHMIIM